MSVPTAAELVEAVREWIERDLIPGVDGQLGFHARVAVNALGIVERELRTEPVRSGGSRLGFDSDAALGAAIRSGALDERFGEVLGILREATKDALAVDDPGYASRV